MFKITKLMQAGVLALASSFVLVPAANAAPIDDLFDDGLAFGNLKIELDSSALATNHTRNYDPVTLSTIGSSTDHETASLYLYDEVSDSDTYSSCDEDFATLTEGVDLILDCPTFTADGAFDGLTIDAEVRIFAPDANDFMVTRILHAVTNTNGTDFTVSELRTNVDFHEAAGQKAWNGGSSVAHAAFVGTEPEVRWFSHAPTDEFDLVKVTYPLYGAAWEGQGSTLDFNIYGDSAADDSYEVWADDVVIPAGETVYFAFYMIAGHHPQDASGAETQARVDLFENFMASFDGNSTGIPEGAVVVNWGSKLAETGTDTVGTFGFAAAMLVAGAAVVVARRRVRS